MEQKEFETLIRRIRPRLHQEAFRHLLDNDEAEDVTQETVLKLWAMRLELDQYRSVEALAIVMARRIALTRKRKKTVPLTDWQKVDLAESNTPETTVISQEEENRVLNLMSKLPDAQKAVLRMKHLDGLETSEIARITGSSEESVRQNLSRARRKIMQMFIK
jgi:RNA polymerase sigma-70 factor (ECF subfamily)